MRGASVSELLFDTDVFVDHIRGRRRLRPDTTGWYSIITRSELFAGRREEEAAVTALLRGHVEIPVDRVIAERAGRLRREARLDLMDALIAATALEHGLQLMTRNARDFAKISGLRLRDPATL